MTRILSYNILVGGGTRIEQITNIIQSTQPDIVGLVEATNPQVVEKLSERLDMQYRMSAFPEHQRDWQVAILSRLPIIRTQVHASSKIPMKPVLEVCIEEANGKQLTVFVTHLTASFSQGWGGEDIRRGEVREILRIMASMKGSPHLLMGDFNALAPGDRLKASMLLRYLVAMDQRHKQHFPDNFGHPNLNFVVPPPLRIFNPMLRLIPRSKLLSALFDEIVSFYAPRRSIRLLYKAGYADCFRRMNPRAWGFTCPAGAPAGRIDFIFASPELASRLSTCKVITEGQCVQGAEASDHLPVFAEFGESVEMLDVRKMADDEATSRLSHI